jgi:hypothetical protein
MITSGRSAAADCPKIHWCKAGLLVKRPVALLAEFSSQ